MIAPAVMVRPALALLLAPLLPGIINKTKAFVAGRRGPPLLQLYYDLFKLLRKVAVFSAVTTGLFRIAPAIGLAATIVVLALLPFAGAPAAVAFPVDFVVLAYLLGLARFATILAALDTGSSFEGMGASREAFFAALTEPVLLVALATLARTTSMPSLSAMFAALDRATWLAHAPVLLPIAGALLVVLLAENARIPVDDPNTHLELTMIHEVMVLDHCGIDFAFISYGAALKLWVFSVLLVDLVVPFGPTGHPANLILGVSGVAAVAVVVGIIESSMARLRLVRVPELLVGAGILTIVGLIEVLGA